MALAVRERDGGEVEVVTDGPEARLCAAVGLLNAATAGVVAAIAEAMSGGGWQGDGIATIEQWVSLRAGVSAARSRRLVALARGLEQRPAAAALFATGGLSEDQAAMVVARSDAAHDARVAELARHCTLGQLQRVLSGLATCDRAEATQTTDTAEQAEPVQGEVPGRRELSFGTHDDGRFWARVLLPAEEGAVVDKALEAARGELFAEGEGGDRISWPDALVRMAEAALSNIEGGARLPADRYQVVVHLDADAPERAALHLGPLLAPAVRQYLTCDATVRVVAERDATPMHVFARRRTVDQRLRILIEQRDRGCRVPGCGRVRWLHVHHLVHHEHGGTTVPENLCCLCTTHHRMHHAGRLGIEGDPTRAEGLRFTDRHGRPMRGPSPRPPKLPLAEAAVAMGLPPPRWQPPLGERLDTACIAWP